MSLGASKPVNTPTPPPAVVKGPNFVEKSAIRFVNWSRNTVIDPQTHKDRNIIKKTVVTVISIVIALFNAIIFIPGLAFLNYALKEHNRQMVCEKQARESVPVETKGLKDKITLLNTQLTTAKREIDTNAKDLNGIKITEFVRGLQEGRKEGEKAGVQRTKTEIVNGVDEQFRAEVKRIAGLAKGKGAALKALLDDSRFKIKA